MKKSSIFLFAFIASISFSIFTACSNFLENSDFKQQLKDDIDYATAEDCSLIISSDTEMGSFLSSGEKTCKVGYSINLQYTVKKDSYIFDSLEAVSSEDPSLSRSENVEFTITEKNEESGLYKIKLTLKKAADDILIRPVCTSLPAVVSYTPQNSSGIPANTQITITFNMPMDQKNVTDNLLLLYTDSALNNTIINDYFEIPQFNSDATILTIVPKSQALKTFIEEKNAAFADISVILGSEIKILSDEKELFLVQNNNSNFKLRYLPEVEETAPKKYDFAVFSDIEVEDSSESDGLYLEDSDINNFSESQILQNRSRNSIRITGRYYDADSGVKTVKITERRTNSKDGTIVSENESISTYTAENSTFSSENGYTVFSINYQLQADDGAILLQVDVIDAAENIDPSQSVSFVAIKDSYIDLSDLNVENTPENIREIWFMATGHPYVNDNWLSNRWENLKKTVYKDCLINASELSVKCEYTDDDNKSYSEDFSLDTAYQYYDVCYETDRFDYRWSYELKNIEDLSGKSFTVKVTDDIGNQSSKTFTFPDKPLFTGVEKGYSSGYVIVNFSHNISRELDDSIYFHSAIFPTQDLVNKEANKIYTTSEEPRFPSVPENIEWYCRNTLSTKSKSYGLYGEACEPFTSTISTSILAPVEVTDITYKKSSRDEYIDVTFYIAADSWEKYDSIYLNYNTDVFFEKGELSKTLQLYTDYMYQYKLVVRVLAEKEGFFVQTRQIKLEQLEGSELDNIKPIFSYLGGNYNFDFLNALQTQFDESEELSHFTMFGGTVKDIGSGLDYFTLKNNATNKTISFPAEEPYYDQETNYLYLPIADFEKEPDYTLTIYDKAGNYTQTKSIGRNLIAGEMPELQTFNSSVIYTSTYPKSYYNWRYYIYEFNASESSWSEKTDSGILGTSYYPSSALNRSHGISMTSNTFYKAIYQANNYSGTVQLSFDYSIPAYYYHGVSNSGDYDYLQANGASKDSVIVSSDAPVLVETLTTGYSYEICKEWTKAYWQRNRRSIGLKQIDFDSSSRAKKYSIPVDYIDQGDCYVVIVHFADGSSTMSEVMQK